MWDDETFEEFSKIARKIEIEKISKKHCKIEYFKYDKRKKDQIIAKAECDYQGFHATLVLYSTKERFLSIQLEPYAVVKYKNKKGKRVTQMIKGAVNLTPNSSYSLTEEKRLGCDCRMDYIICTYFGREYKVWEKS